MNKKYFSLITASILVFSFSAKAEGKFYAGVDANYQTLSFETKPETSEVIGTNIKGFKAQSLNVNKTKLIPNFFAGFDDGSNFKYELSYNQSKYAKNNDLNSVFSSSLDRRFSTKESNSEKYTFKTQSISFDVKPYYKINDRFSIYGIAGVNHYRVSLKQDSYYSYSDINAYSSEFTNDTFSQSKTTNIFAPTLGFGGEIEVVKNVFARAQFKYSHLNKKVLNTKLQSVMNSSVGVGYYF